jgi:hypothetical protein
MTVFEIDRLERHTNKKFGYALCSGVGKEASDKVLVRTTVRRQNWWISTDIFGEERRPRIAPQWLLMADLGRVGGFLLVRPCPNNYWSLTQKTLAKLKQLGFAKVPQC